MVSGKVVRWTHEPPSQEVRAALERLARDEDVHRVAVMPDGQDPDSLIRSEGADAFRSILDNARPFFDYQVDRGLVALDRLTAGVEGRILAKLDYLLPGFSKKDRAARRIIGS